MKRPRKLLNIELNVRKIRMMKVGKRKEHPIPSAMAISTLGKRPILIFFMQKPELESAKVVIIAQYKI